MKFSRLHIWLLLIQLCGSLLVYVVIVPFNAELAQGILICVLAPTATAAAVITGMLGGNIAFLASFVFLSNVLVAVAAPVIFSFLGTNSDLLLGIVRLHLPSGSTLTDTPVVGGLAGAVAFAPRASVAAFRSDSVILYVVAGTDYRHGSHSHFPVGAARPAL